jgi:hypothetical protein
MLPSIVASDTSMTGSEEGTGDDMRTMIQNDNANNNNMAMMSDSTPKASMYIQRIVYNSNYS